MLSAFHREATQKHKRGECNRIRPACVNELVVFARLAELFTAEGLELYK